MNATIALAALALVTVVGASKLPHFKPPPPLEPKLVTTESWRSQRSDTNTFALRWRDISQLPPAMAIAEAATPLPRSRPSEADEVRRPKAGARTPHREVRPRDLCERHNRRKVYVSRYRWRCLK